jgi:hypothetical protein
MTLSMTVLLGRNKREVRKQPAPPKIGGLQFKESLTAPGYNERESFGRAVDMSSTAAPGFSLLNQLAA